MSSIEFHGRDIAFQPVTDMMWSDLEELFGDHGAYSGCWCMWWRIKRSEFENHGGAGNKKALKKIVLSGIVPGILAFHGDRPIGWCSVAPREQFPVLDRSYVLKPIDDKPVWCIVCFFVHKMYRRRGLSRILIQGAIRYASENGARIIEAYPVDKEASKNTSIDGFTGFVKPFLEMGFREEARRTANRPILRYYIEN